MSFEDIITDLYNSEFLNSLLTKITSNHELKDDLKQELFLILCSNPKKIIDAYENKYLNYYVVNIVKKMYHSNTSPFHYKFRKFNSLRDSNIEISDSFDSYSEKLYEAIIQKKDDNRDILSIIMKIINEDLHWFQRELIKLRYKLDQYDGILGSKRDKSCHKTISSFRQMENFLTIKFPNQKHMKNGNQLRKLSIDHSSLHIYHQKSIDFIRQKLKDYGVQTLN